MYEFLWNSRLAQYGSFFIRRLPDTIWVIRLDKKYQLCLYNSNESHFHQVI